MEAMATEGGALEDMEVMEVTAIMGRDPQKLKQGMATVAMVDIAQEVMEAMVDMEALEDMEGMATEVMEAMALAAMEVMGTARGQQILAMATVGALATEATGVTAGVM